MADSTQAEQRAEVLKERIYITFTSLAIVLALSSHAAELSSGSIATTLLIGVGGTLLAVFVADLVAYIAVHAQLPHRAELSHMVSVSTRALGVVVLPLIFVGLAAVGVWDVPRALRASTVVLIASLVAIGYLAARRVTLRMPDRLVVLFAEFVLGLAVVLLEVLAHHG